MKPLVSIVITTKNSDKHINNCLKSIKEQSYENIEIIIVDSDSKDKTREIAKRYSKLVYNKKGERSTGRNYGMISKSKGKYVMFIDSDMILSPSLVENCVLSIKKQACLALFIPEVILGKSFFSKVRCFERSFYNGTVIDGARFFLKKAFVKSKGFDEKLYAGEDWDIDKKIKKIGRIGLLNEDETKNSNWCLRNFILRRGINPDDHACVIYHNESDFNLKNYLRKKNYYTDNIDQYINKWGSDDSDVKKQFGLFYRLFWVFLENGKWKKLILKPHMTFGLYYLRFRVALNFLINFKWRKK